MITADSQKLLPTSEGALVTQRTAARRKECVLVAVLRQLLGDVIREENLCHVGFEFSVTGPPRALESPISVQTTAIAVILPQRGSALEGRTHNAA